MPTWTRDASKNIEIIVHKNNQKKWKKKSDVFRKT